MSPRSRLSPWVGYALVSLVTLVVCSPLLSTAFFCLDDYRYLQGLRDFAAGDSSAWARSVVVENRWDDHWWIPDDTYVRFFRPYMISSYMMDEAIWGGADAVGFTITNVLMHTLTTVLVLACFVLLLGPGIGSLMGALSFGVQYAHFENLYYVPGRAMTMATIGMAAALLAHLCTRRDTSVTKQLLVAGLCGAAFFGKEAAALLPVFLILLDWLVPTGEPRSLWYALRRNAPLVVTCTVLAAAYLWIRTSALGEAGPGTNVYPYIHWPQREGFAERTLAVWVMYCAGITTGSFIHTFAEFPRQIYAGLGMWEIVLGCAWVHGLIIVCLADRRGRWLVLLFALSILPLLPLYSSGRHLYTATIGYCGLLGLVVQRAWALQTNAGRTAAGVIVAVFIALPGARLAIDLVEYPPRLSQPDPVDAYAEMIENGELELDPTRPAYLLDFPGGWYEMQFAEAFLEVALDRELPELHFLSTTRVGGKRPIHATKLDDHTIELDRGGLPILPFGGGRGGFDLRAMSQGTEIHKRGFTVRLAEVADSGRPTRIRVRFDAPLREIQLGQFIRPEGQAWTLAPVEL